MYNRTSPPYHFLSLFQRVDVLEVMKCSTMITRQRLLGLQPLEVISLRLQVQTSGTASVSATQSVIYRSVCLAIEHGRLRSLDAECRHSTDADVVAEIISHAPQLVDLQLTVYWDDHESLERVCSRFKVLAQAPSVKTVSLRIARSGMPRWHFRNYPVPSLDFAVSFILMLPPGLSQFSIIMKIPVTTGSFIGTFQGTDWKSIDNNLCSMLSLEKCDILLLANPLKDNDEEPIEDDDNVPIDVDLHGRKDSNTLEDCAEFIRQSLPQLESRGVLKCKGERRQLAWY